MHVYLLQRPIVWEEPQENFRQIENILDESPPQGGSLLVLAEMFSTGFSFDLEKVGEPEHGSSSEFLRHLAMKYGVAVVGSFPHQPSGGGKGLNRLLAYLPGGELACYYDKIHPFSYGKEADHYRGGNRLPVFSYQGWKICPTICYDLRFPELYRKATLDGGAELFLCIANWPTPRRDHWNTLLRARAIENQVAMVAVNRIGNDPLNGYSGDSVVIDSRGRDLLNLETQEKLAGILLDRDKLLEWRKRFPALSDATHDFSLHAS
jgi:predicted amidohydrolase